MAPAAAAGGLEAGLRLLGMAMLGAALAYVLMCAFAKQRGWMLRGHSVTLLRPRLGLAQLVVSCANWLPMWGLVYLLLQPKVYFPQWWRCWSPRPSHA